MKNKRSLFAVPYVVLDGPLRGGPHHHGGGLCLQHGAGPADFTLENFARMGTYTAVFTRSFKLAIIATADLLC